MHVSRNRQCKCSLLLSKMTMAALEKNMERQQLLSYQNIPSLIFHYLSIAESYGEPSKVSIDDFNGGVSRTGDVEHAGIASDDLLVILSTWIMDNNI